MKKFYLWKFAVLMVFVLCGKISLAQSNYYIGSPSTTWGGFGTSDWSTISGGPYSNTYWVNGNYANLQGSAAYTLNPVSTYNPRVYGLYSLNTLSSTISAGDTLYLSGSTTPSIGAANSSTFTIKNVIGGGLGFNLNESGTTGTLTLGASNRNYGMINIYGGTLTFTSSAIFAGASLRNNPVNLVNSSSTLSYSASTSADIRLGTLIGSGTLSNTKTGKGFYLNLTQSGSSSATISTVSGAGNGDGLTVMGIGGNTQTLTGNTTACEALNLYGTRLTDGTYTNYLTLSGTNTTFKSVIASPVTLQGGRLMLDNSGGNVTTFSTTAGLPLINFNGGELYLKGNTSGTTLVVGKDSSVANQYSLNLNNGLNIITVETPTGATARTQLSLAGTTGGTGLDLRLQTFMAIDLVAVSGTLGGSATTDPRIVFQSGSNLPDTDVNTSMLNAGTAGKDLGWAVVNGNTWATYDNNTTGFRALAFNATPTTNTGLQSLTTSSVADYQPSVDQTLTANVTTGSLRITPNGSTNLNCGTYSLTTLALMYNGSGNFNITGTGSLIDQASTKNIWVTNASGSLTTNMPIPNTSGNPINKIGPGFLVLTGASTLNGGLGQVISTGSVKPFDIMQGTVRCGNAQLQMSGTTPSSDNIALGFKGGVLEITGGSNLTGTSADFTRPLGTGSGDVYWYATGTPAQAGSGGFSAYGSDASVNIGGLATPATLTWSNGTSSYFLQDGYSLIFGSTQSEHTLNFLNPIALDTVTVSGDVQLYNAREIYVYNNAGLNIADLQGTITGTANTDLAKTGPGILELGAVNTYAGNTIIQAGTLVPLQTGSLPATTHVILLGGTLQLDAAQTITDITINSGATLNLNGYNLTVTGDFTNNGGTITGTGTVIFNGTSQQFINGQAVTFSGGLTINNAYGVVMANNVTVNGTTSLTSGILGINGNTLTLNGAVSYPSPGTGTLAGSLASGLQVGSSSYTANTAGTLQFTPNSTTLTDSPYNNYLSSLKLYSNATATLGDTLNIAPGTSTLPGVVSVGHSGSTAGLTTGGFLVLRSDSGALFNGTARVDSNTIGTNYISGNVSIQRFIPSHRAWRLLTAPISSNETVNAAWQEGVNTTSTTSLVNPHSGYGTEITDKLSTSSSTGFDAAATNNPSILYLNGGAWTTPTNTNSFDINSEPGYMLFVRGDRSVVVTTPPFNPSTTTILRSTGSLNQGTVNITPPAASFQVIGNPYASETNLDHIFATYPGIVGSNYYLWDPLNTGHEGVGSFVTVSYDGSPGSYSFTAHSRSFNPGKIESGEAFLFDFGAASAISFQETDKATQSALVFRPADAPVQSFATELLSVNADSSTELDDGTLELYGTRYSDSVNFLQDARKIPNPAEMISEVRDGYLLAIEKKRPITVTDTIFYNIKHMNQQTYRFAFIPNNLVQPGLTALLQDLYLKTSTPVNLYNGDTTYVSFAVTGDSASFGNRFRIVFLSTPAKATLPFMYTSVKACQGKDNTNIAVQWAVANQLDVKEYQVQKSLDGNTYTAVATVTATSDSLYNWMDASAVNGENYYRIAGVVSNGTLQYSEAVNVMIGTAQGIAVYPNPVKDEVIGLQMNNMQGGNYTIRLINNIGQVIMEKNITLAAGCSFQTVPVNNISKGVYHLEVSKPGTSINNIKVLF